MEKQPFGQQKSGRFEEQKAVILMGNSDLEKRHFLTTKFVAFVELPPSRQKNNESRSTKEQKKRGI